MWNDEEPPGSTQDDHDEFGWWVARILVLGPFAYAVALFQRDANLLVVTFGLSFVAFFGVATWVGVRTVVVRRRRAPRTLVLLGAACLLWLAMSPLAIGTFGRIVAGLAYFGLVALTVFIFVKARRDGPVPALVLQLAAIAGYLAFGAICVWLFIEPWSVSAKARAAWGVGGVVLITALSLVVASALAAAGYLSVYLLASRRRVSN